MKLLSNLIMYDALSLFNEEIVFYDVTLLTDISTTKGTFEKGLNFAEAELDLDKMCLTFFNDYPDTGYETEFEINVKLEHDI